MTASDFTIVRAPIPRGALQIGDDYSPTEKTIILYGVARGLCFLHANRIVHRGIRPDAVLLDSYKYPKLTDFGLAKLGDSPQSFVVDTTFYDAPEVLSGSDYTFPSDVYACAILFYEIIEGKKATLPQATSRPRLMKSVIDGKRPAIAKATAQQAELLEQMWHDHPDWRPTLRDVCQALERHELWTQGTDRHAFWQYKAMLDTGEADAVEDGVVRPSWLERASHLDAIQTAVSGIEVTELAAQILAFLTTDTDGEQRQYLVELLRESFAKSKCIDRLLLGDYARRYLKAPIMRQAGFALSPLTAAIVEPDSAHQTWIVETVEPGDDSLKVCQFFREVIKHVYCAHPAISGIVGWNFLARRSQLVIISEEPPEDVAGLTGLTPTEKTIVVYGIARALEQLHSLAVCHGSVRPENIVFGDRKFPRLRNRPIGGPSVYTAPEQHLSFPADVYAYGITFWEIVNGDKWSTTPADDDPFLGAMIDASPEKRLGFGEIVCFLENKEYWVEGTDEGQFRAYVDSVDKEEGTIVVESGSECLHFLRDESAIKLLAGQLKGDLAEKVIGALGWLCGTAGFVNQDVMDAVRESLEKRGILVPAVVNGKASQPVID